MAARSRASTPRCSIRVIGASFAVAAGFGFAVSAAFQKAEAVQVRASVPGLLAELIKRRRWLGATLLSLLAWVAEAKALSAAPVAVVMPLMGTGTALLVALGVRWLGERFRRRELLAIVLVGIGGPVAAIIASGPVVQRPLSLAALLTVDAVALACALAALLRRTGVAYGLAAGFLYAATGVYTKEIGDRFAVDGFRATGLLLASPVPWLLAGNALFALALAQAGFQRANAATVTAAMTAPDTLGPILAGFLLYHEAYPRAAAGAAFALAAIAVVCGVALASMTGEQAMMASSRRIRPGRTEEAP